MKNKLKNPFVTGGYIEPDYFCDRQDETARLLGAIRSKRNTTLISLRRMGKTGLLKHIKYLIEKEKKSPLVVYTDLLPTMSGNDMLNVLTSSLLREKQHDKNILQKLLSLLSTLRPKVTLDSLTGQPSLELTVETAVDIQFGFNHLMQFISDMKQDLVFMLDEFQQISRYPEKNMEQILRTVIQAYPLVPFIFSGSSKHMLEPMFNSAGRPFYQSSELMYLEKIPQKEYESFIEDKFEKAGKKISKEALETIMEWSCMHTFYVQHICNLLYESLEQNINLKLTRMIFTQIMTLNEPLFTNYRNLLPKHQYRLLQAIAVESGIEKPTSGSFIQQYSLTSASSVKTSLNALADKEMIVHSGGKWQVYDVFFSRWLEYHYGGR